ncbi:MAG: hypothetical protein O7C59_09175 [Rickettsia endosymbiont of Ixodes persulcatus]|uniref:hypothetical protein n=1 Tax=unclassified Rickettsia TaxID=114295 RepID=UPI0022BC1264|nr:hypothetical protein [Rickettsia endosymbiont of Ixodes persulcatus]MCZ6902723.1 hypothetical protein [Rickettsia endosymbiont of Ixodes persulcatus]MCZ6908939.1 hypothetical protein [Rickettsia endosymbiont of Ixodes persulcatus]MCZ6914600.1 hypothetical protein [Rickettsia endosymbiont of Ixodes persulcatus]MCZ6919013.1 hypothetical protein [Rickettsia endosymbiont of Ixodes persulcatus]
MNNNCANQRLYWSLSTPLKYMALSLDEWLVILLGIVPGIVLLNSGHAKLGMICIIAGIVLCYAFKKFKKLSEYFVLKSYLVAKKWLYAPTSYPNLLGKKVGK